MINETQAAKQLEELISYANAKLHLDRADNVYVRNLALDLLKIKEPSPPADSFGSLQEILDPILDYAVSKGLCDVTETDKILFETRLMGLFSPLPSFVNKKFNALAAKDGAEAATDFLNGYSVACNYIRTCDINKNLQWETTGKFGKIIVTINRSKPEKDPKDIEKAKNTPKGAYPKCALCKENVGFAGNVNQSARQTLRTVPIVINGEPWQLQFSPYVYYRKHCIALSDDHHPMKVDGSAFVKMFDFTDLFPHFFIGSNAALPIVGGSILAHDHFQGGDKVLPMFNSAIRKSFDGGKYKNVSLSILNWYNSVVRLESKNRAELIDCASDILAAWQSYSDISVGVVSHTGDTPHNAVTPIARLEPDGRYILDMILRNNRTDEAHPFGIFHPPVTLHNIKKEGIGIIEVMGLFILPGRLYEERQAMAKYLTGEVPLNIERLFYEDNPLSKHAHAVTELADKHGLRLSKTAAIEAVTDYINETCERILECTAVFKNTREGQTAFTKFIKTVLSK